MTKMNLQSRRPRFWILIRCLVVVVFVTSTYLDMSLLSPSRMAIVPLDEEASMLRTPSPPRTSVTTGNEPASSSPLLDSSTDVVLNSDMAHRRQKIRQEHEHLERTISQSRNKWLGSVKEWAKETNDTLLSPALACPTGNRIAVYGSSHARSLAFSLAAALTGDPYPTATQRRMGDEMHVPLFDEARSVFNMFMNRTMGNICTSHTVDVQNACNKPEYQEMFERREVCRYTYDAGVNIRNCGYPHQKRWALDKDSYHSTVSVPIDQPVHPLPQFSDASFTQLYYLFKTFIYTPEVDAQAKINVLQFHPSAVILDFTMWGCREPEMIQAGPVLPEDEARNCTLDFINAVDFWEDGLDDNIPIIHFFNSKVIRPREELQALSGVVRNLQETSLRRVHLSLDKADVLNSLPPGFEESLGHGYFGTATDIWARSSLDAICTI